MVQTDSQAGAPRRTSDTRELLLEAAESAVLAKGFSATCIDELIAAVGVTKGAFFYHFKNKGELAEAMLLRYLERDRVLLDDLFGRADELNEDPLHGFLVALKLFAEMLGNLPETHPGCLAAAICYQDQLFSPEIRKLNAQGVLAWRQRFRERLDRIAAVYPPTRDVDLEALSDAMMALVEGGLILGRVLGDTQILPRQILLFRDYVRSAFMPAAARPALEWHAPRAA
jgi:AcrR family transcriptional regulator